MSTFKWIVFAVAVNDIWNILLFLKRSGYQELHEYIMRYFETENLLHLLLFNSPVHTEPLWYLFSMIYVYALLYFVVKYKVSDRIVFTISLFLLTANLIFSELFSAFHIFVNVKHIRNFLFFGIPFFTIVLICRKYKHMLVSVPNLFVILSVISGVYMTIVSYKCFGKKELYCGSLLILASLVVLSIKYADNKYPSELNLLYGCSIYIYIFHLIISKILLKMYSVLYIDYTTFFMRISHPLFVCLVTTVAALIFKYSLILLKQFLNNIQHT